MAERPADEPVAGAPDGERDGEAPVESSPAAAETQVEEPSAPVGSSVTASDTAVVEAIDEIEDIEEIDLEALLRGEIVLSVSRSVDRVQDAPANVTVVTREQMRLWGYQSVAEVLEHTVGFYVVDDHVLPNVGVRGVLGGLRAESGLLQVMIDGRPISFRPTGGNWLGPELVPLTAVEQIEIVRGPTSTVYGADAFLGVVNIVTRQARTFGAPAVETADAQLEGGVPQRSDGGGAELRLSGNYAGGFGGGLDLAVGGRSGDFSALVALRADRQDRSGSMLPPSSPAPVLRPGVTRDRAARDLVLDSATAYGRFTYHIDAHNEISLTAQASAIDRGGEFSEWLQLSNGIDAEGRPRGTRISLARGYVNLAASLRPVEQLRITANAGYFGAAPLPSDRIDVRSDVSYVRREMDSHAGRFDVGAQWTPIETLRIVGGVDVLYDRETLPGVLRVLFEGDGVLEAGSIDETVSQHGARRDFVNVGVFLLGTWNPIDSLRVDGGLRYDYNNIYGNQINGRFAGSLRIIEELSVKLSYGSAFRAPTTQLLYGVPLVVGDILGNSALRPQQTHNVEASLHARPWEWLRVQTAVSYSYFRDIASFVQVGVNSVALNLAELSALSWETEARVNWNEQLSAYVDFALVTGVRNLHEESYRAALIGSDLEAYPPYVLNGGVAHRFVEIPLRLTVEGRFVSDRRASDRNILEAGAIYTLPAAFYLDASIAVVDLRLLPERATTFSFVVRNLLDNRAGHPGFSGIDYPSAPRLFLLQWQQEL